MQTESYFVLKCLKEQKRKEYWGQNNTNFQSRNEAYCSCMYIQIDGDTEHFLKHSIKHAQEWGEDQYPK